MMEQLTQWVSSDQHVVISGEQLEIDGSCRVAIPELGNVKCTETTMDDPDSKHPYELVTIILSSVVGVCIIIILIECAAFCFIKRLE